MAAAPNPKALAAAQAEADALAAAEETRKFREGLVCRLTLNGEFRTLRFLDFTGLDARPLRDAAGLSHNQLWRGLLPPGEPDLDIFLAGWWLAGRHDGVVESLPALLGKSYEETLGLYWPSDEELAADGVDDDSPPV